MLTCRTNAACCAQGMTTNDLRLLEQPGAGPIYTVLLTAKGKYLHDLLAYSLPGGSTHPYPVST
jgi:folate-binding Fe-S cluster repair protein YgfZ